MKNVRIAVVGAFALVMNLPSASGAVGPDPGAQVEIVDRTFTPQQITIKAGDYATWHHVDGESQHSVTADDMAFDSNPACNPGPCMRHGDTFAWVFLKPGRYTYHCRLHAQYGMVGTITVE